MHRLRDFAAEVDGAASRRLFRVDRVLRSVGSGESYGE